MSATCEGVSEMRQSDTNTSKTELERKIRQRVACEERAHRIVEKLLEGPVTDHYLIECGQYITPSHYEDIVEERAIIRLCGYPVCGNSLGKVPQQKYFISTKSNKVYDITERKNFCSNQCFKASRYFERQISTTPVWLRDKEKSETLRVLDPSKNGGSPGLEVVGKKQVSALQREAELLAQDMGDPSETTATETSVLNPAVPFNSGNTSQDKLKSKSELVSDSESSDEKLSQQLSLNLQIRDSEQSVKDSKINSGKAASETLADGQQSKTPAAISKTEYLMQLLNKRQNLLSKMVDDQPEQTIVKKQHSKGESEKANFLQKNAEQGKNLPTEPPKLSIIEKNTEIMSKIRLGAHSSERPEAETDTHADKDVSGSSFMRKLQTSFPQLSPQMLLICTRLFDWLTEDSLKYLKLIKDDHPNCKPDEKEAEDLTITSEIERDKKVSIKGVTATENERTIEARSENSVDFHTIREQSQNFQIKVREFYKGSFTYKPPEGADYQGSGQSDNTSEIVLPPVDSMAQNTLRRKIVLQKVEKSISEMLTPLGLAIQHIATDLRQLVATFSLTSTNVILKPAEWSLMSLFLIKMLSLCVPVVWKSFNEGRSLHFFKAFLSALGASLKDVDEILNHIYSEKIQEQKIL